MISVIARRIDARCTEYTERQTGRRADVIKGAALYWLLLYGQDGSIYANSYPTRADALLALEHRLASVRQAVPGR